MRALHTTEQHRPTRTPRARLALVDAAVPYSSSHGLSADIVSPQATYTWDDFGRKIKETDPLGKFWKFEYDQNNNLTKSTDAKAQLTQFAYSPRGLLLTRTDHSGKKTAYTYNALGQVLTAQNPEVTYSHSYDSAHRLASVTDSRGGKKINYAYSPGGLLNKMSDNESRRTDYLYDSVGRLTGIWAPNDDYVAYVYDVGRRLTEKWFPNGVNAQYTWNTDSTLAQVKNRFNYSDTFVVSQHDYSYNGVGQCKDALEKLGVYTPPAINDTYGYDALGNRVRSTGAANLFFEIDAANQLLAVHSGSINGPMTQAYVYDANGNMTQKCDGGTVTRSATSCTGNSVTTLTYNALDQLAQVNKDGTLSQYAYDDAGRRIRKTVNGNTTNYLYNGPDIQAEYQSWSQANISYTHGPNTDEPAIRVNAANDANYFHQDGLGSVVATTDASSSLTAAQLYDAWGKPNAGTGGLGQYGYTGREPDTESGLMYYRARYYDPSIGRFTQRDPIGLRGGINQYAYVNNNPVSNVDPLGLVDFYYDINKPVPKIINLPQQGNRIFVEGEGGGVSQNGKQYFPSADWPVKGGHTGVINGQITGQRINDITATYHNAPTGLLDLAIGSAKNNGPYDFKPYFEASKMHVVDGRAYLNDYPSNIAWAGMVKSMGVSKSNAILGSDVQSILFGKNHTVDDARDISAIKRGYAWNSSLEGYRMISNGQGSQNLQQVSNPPFAQPIKW